MSASTVSNKSNATPNKKQRWWQTGVGLMVLAVLLVLGVLVLKQLPPWRLDFSEDKLFTLSEGTRSILKNLQQDVQLDLYFSEQATLELPQLRDYATRVRELLHEYELVSGGKVKLNVIDPEPFSEAEDSATEAGLQGVSSHAGSDSIFFGLVGSANVGDAASSDEDTVTTQEVISFFNPDRESFLEYDLSQLVYRVANTNPTVVGVITSAPVFDGMDFSSQRRTESWLIISQLQQLAEVRELDQDSDVIDADVNILLIIHPQDLPDKTLYAVDQFILGGGKAVIAVDPHAELIAASQGMMGMMAPSSSNLEKLFSAWGVQYDDTQVVADAEWALRLPSGDRGIQLPHLGIIGVGESSLNHDDIATAELETVNFATSGFFRLSDSATVEMMPLISSSDKAMPMASSKFIQLQNHGELLRDFVPTGEIYPLVARVRGEVPSAFPEGPPSVADKTNVSAEENSDVTENATNATNATDTGAATKNIIPSHLNKSDGNINVVLFADTDVLTDRLWVQVSNFFGQRVAAPWANNGDLFSNVVESLAGSSELINVRSRGTFARPFTVIQDLELAAAERFQTQEQVLVDKLDELEQRIQQLSQDQNGAAVIQLNPEQAEEIRKFEQEKLGIRKELRQVQHQLNQDIEALQTRLMFYNILLIPGLIVLAAVAMAWFNARRRRQH